MKTRLTILRRILICGIIFASTAGFGQVTQIWTGGDGTGTDLGAATNWGGTLPSTANNDTGEWNGVAPGNLSLVYNYDYEFNGGPGQPGINLYLTENQTGAVTIGTSIRSVSAALALDNITIDRGAGAFTLGGTNPASLLYWVARPSGAVHYFVNNSTNPATFGPAITFAAGGGAAWTMDFSGSGDWQCNSYLVDNNGPYRFIQVDGPGTMIWNPSGFLGSGSLASPIVINGGALVLTGPHPRLFNQAITNQGTFEFNAPSQAQTLSGVLSGPGRLVVSNGTLTLNAANTYFGSNLVSNGTLIINSTNLATSTLVYGGTLGGTGTLSGPVTLLAGTRLAPGVSGSLGTLIVNHGLSIGGNVAIGVNKSWSPANTQVVVSGVLTNTGMGILTVTNLGPTLAVGDKFTVFNQPLANGAALTVAGAGAIWANNLWVDGSIKVLSIFAPPTLEFAKTARGLQLTWTGSFKLQEQTNGLTTGLDNNWADFPDGNNSPVTAPFDMTTGSVFFRLVSTP